VKEDAVVVGIGNPWRGDDAVGWLVAERVAEVVGEEVRVVQVDGEPGRLLDTWDGARLAVVIDGMRTGRQVGTVIVFSADEVRRAEASHSTHGIGLAYAVQLGTVLGRVPEELVVVGVEVGEVVVGQPMTPEVESALDGATAQVLATVRGTTVQALGGPGR